jgi:tetratricopeptide (TPR) repeat protein
MEKIYIIIFLLICNFSFSQNEIEEVKLPISGENVFIKDFKFTSNNVGFLLLNESVGENSFDRLYKTTDYGDSFEELFIQKGNTDDWYEKIDIYNDIIHLYTFYRNGEIHLYSTDYGINWLEPNNMDYEGWDIFYVKSDCIFKLKGYYDEDKILYFSSDFGTNWIKKVKITDNNLINKTDNINYYFRNEYDGFLWISSDDNKKDIFFKTTNSGINWQKINLPNLDNEYLSHASEMYFKDSLNGIFYINSRVFLKNNSIVLYTTTDGGNKWERIKMSVEYKFTYNYDNFNPLKIKYQYPNTIWIASVSLPDKFICYSTDNGLNFSFIDVKFNEDGEFIRNIQLIESQDACLVISSEKIYKVFKDNALISGDILRKKSLANNLKEENKYDKALELYIDLINNYNIFDENIIFRTAFCLHNLKRESEAIYYYKKLLEIKPDNFTYNYDIALAYKTIGDIENSIYYFNEALKYNPKKYNIYISLGNVYKEKGQYDDAIDCYKKALKINPEDKTAKNNLASLEEFLILYSNKKYEERYNNIVYTISNINWVHQTLICVTLKVENPTDDYLSFEGGYGSYYLKDNQGKTFFYNNVSYSDRYIMTPNEKIYFSVDFIINYWSEDLYLYIPNKNIKLFVAHKFGEKK